MKGILVIDMPKDCLHCRLRTVIHVSDHFYQMCRLQDAGYLAEPYFKEQDLVDGFKYKYCPLRPLPQKNKYDVEKYATVDYENDVTLGHYLNKGWNDCLKEITGETE